ARDSQGDGPEVDGQTDLTEDGRPGRLEDARAHSHEDQQLGDQHQTTAPAPALQKTEACREESTAEDHEPGRSGVTVDHHRVLTVTAHGAYDEHERRQHSEGSLARRYPSGDPNRGGNRGPRVCRPAASVR